VTIPDGFRLNGESGRPSMNAMSRGLPVEFSRDSLDAVCRRYGILRLSVFGSALRDDFMAESDLDVLVEFQPHRVALRHMLDHARKRSTWREVDPEAISMSIGCCSWR